GLGPDALGLDSTAEPTTSEPKDRASELWDLATERIEAGKYAEAVPLLRELTQLNPNDWSVRLQLGIAYCVCRLYDDAVEFLREAVRLKPDLFEAWMWLGRSLKGSPGDRLERLKNLDAAADALRQALTIRPDDFDVLLELEHVYTRKNDYRTAVSFCE